MAEPPRTRPRVLVVQHEHECPPAWFGAWLEEAGCDLDVCRPFAGRDLPTTLRGYDGLLVLGGHMGAYDDAEFPWLAEVKELARHAVAERVPTFGICLGHQLLAVALGGTVRTNPRGQQLGVVPIGWRAEADPVLADRPRAGIQWNDDIIEKLPEGAVVLAATPLGELQAVRFAAAAWGVQPHPEADLPVVAPWAEQDRPRQGDDVVDAALAEVVAAEPELLTDWRRVAGAFARRVMARCRAAGDGVSPAVS